MVHVSSQQVEAERYRRHRRPLPGVRVCVTESVLNWHIAPNSKGVSAMKKTPRFVLKEKSNVYVRGGEARSNSGLINFTPQVGRILCAGNYFFFLNGPKAE